MRKPIWTSRRWQLPSQLRRDRFNELMANGEFEGSFNQSLIDGLEKRRDLLEGRQFKLLAIQAPLLLLLAFSLVNIDVSVSLAGISVKATKALREVLLVLSALFGIGASAYGRQLVFLSEMLKAHIARLSNKNEFAREFLETRYGLSDLSHKPFDDDLRPGIIQKIAHVVTLVCQLILLIMFSIMLFSIQVASLVAIYREPNFSLAVSLFVIVFVLLVDLVGFCLWFLYRSLQPYESEEDWKRLKKLHETDEKKWGAIIDDMMYRHYAKGPLWRLATRPRLGRVP
jgi:hypothetical protein